ncbi:sensor histidine kinase [Pullulanibacillus camelliae]|uniref:histidine kinase n=1 Tax=Pullulanibacillus camelliae TaxID=1707096 RepID=A0A8J2VM67_9BACL|nr:histidine kinase N-terminal domain-containing protein [Pullulanibacillus camelliae]GGE31974.1 sensor histidine kinase [Pullulanibacillus camelliae]
MLDSFHDTRLIKRIDINFLGEDDSPLSTLSSSALKVIEHLEANREQFIEEWKNHNYIHEEDIYKDRAPENALAMYHLFVRSLTHTLSLQEIQKLADKVAHERAEANINIGDFVYNVNLGQSILIHFINRSGIDVKDLYSIIDVLNTTFNEFTYYAVKKYTELKEKDLQEKVLYINQSHKERLSLLGQMSSSFVHEFRNPLTSVMGFVKLLKSGKNEPMYLDIIEHELSQLNFRITQFLHTSKIEFVEKNKKDVILILLIDEILDFIYPSLLDGDIEIVTDFKYTKAVHASEDELKQVFINILLNSIDAVKLMSSPRKIYISCQKEEQTIKISLSNNGPAIPEHTLKTIFEPFYTTKELGTGIGLYVCKKIIEKHGGHIDCQSDATRTTFDIYLPIA